MIDRAARFPKPLTGMLVLDLSLLFPGPYCTNQLAAFGARILKVESPDGDPMRLFSPRMFEELNRDTESVVIDLKSDAGKAVFRRLVERADAVVEGFRPGVMTRLGLGYESLNEINPRLVYCAVSGFGQDGPYRDKPGHDLGFLALAGYYSVPSQINDAKTRPNVRLADVIGGQFAAYAVSMALWQAQLSGAGSLVDVSIYDAVASMVLPMIFSSPGLKERDIEQMPHVMADSDLFETRDGRFLALITFEDKFWKAFARAVESLCPQLMDPRFATRLERNRHKRELGELLPPLFRHKTLAEWQAYLAGVDTAWSPVYEGEELLTDPHFRARGFVRGVGGAIPATPEQGYSLFPVKFDGMQETVSRSAPSLGAQTEAVLRELGLEQPEIDRLRRQEVIRT